jgi:hypothetical protein
LNDDTVYNSSVVADTRVPGRLRFPKVYAHYNNGQKSYFRINADLFSPELSENYSETIAYMGTASDNETPFFANLSYEQATDSILTFDMLKIDAQYYTDTLGNQVYISGVTEPGHNYPLSRIEYLGTSKTIKRIVLELNVTKNDAVDRVIEVYIPN